MKITITAAVLTMSLISTSSAFADETQNLVSNSSMQISKISMAQGFSAFDGVETFDVSKAELDEAAGNFNLSHRFRPGIFKSVRVIRCVFSAWCGGKARNAIMNNNNW